MAYIHRCDCGELLTVYQLDVVHSCPGCRKKYRMRVEVERVDLEIPFEKNIYNGSMCGSD